MCIQGQRVRIRKIGYGDCNLFLQLQVHAPRFPMIAWMLSLLILIPCPCRMATWFDESHSDSRSAAKSLCTHRCSHSKHENGEQQSKGNSNGDDCKCNSPSGIGLLERRVSLDIDQPHFEAAVIHWACEGLMTRSNFDALQDQFIFGARPVGLRLRI